MRTPLLLLSLLALACSSEPFGTVDAGDGGGEAGGDAAPTGDARADGDTDASAPSWEALGAPPGPGFQFRALRVQTPNDVWLVGGVANVATTDHWVQGTHNLVTVPGYTTLQALDMKGPNDGVAVGNGGFATYNGTTWTGLPHSKGNLVGVWYSMPTNAYYAASATGMNFKLQGTSFADMTGSPPNGLTCNAMSAMITVCNNAVVLRYDDQLNAFDKQLSGPPTSTDFLAIDRRGTTTLAVGTGGGFADIGVGGFTPGKIEIKANFGAVWVSAAGEVFAVGEGGVIAHRAANQTIWEAMTSPTSQTLRAVGGIEVNGKLTVYAAGDNSVLLRYVR